MKKYLVMLESGGERIIEANSYKLSSPDSTIYFYNQEDNIVASFNKHSVTAVILEENDEN